MSDFYHLTDEQARKALAGIVTGTDTEKNIAKVGGRLVAISMGVGAYLGTTPIVDNATQLSNCVQRSGYILLFSGILGIINLIPAMAFAAPNAKRLKRSERDFEECVNNKKIKVVRIEEEGYFPYWVTRNPDDEMGGIDITGLLPEKVLRCMTRNQYLTNTVALDALKLLDARRQKVIAKGIFLGLATCAAAAAATLPFAIHSDQLARSILSSCALGIAGFVLGRHKSFSSAYESEPVQSAIGTIENLARERVIKITSTQEGRDTIWRVSGFDAPETAVGFEIQDRRIFGFFPTSRLNDLKQYSAPQPNS